MLIFALKWLVVPQSYRRFFPERLKSYSSHDVVLLCIACHRRAEILAEHEHDAVALTLGLPGVYC